MTLLEKLNEAIKESSIKKIVILFSSNSYIRINKYHIIPDDLIRIKLFLDQIGLIRIIFGRNGIIFMFTHENIILKGDLKMYSDKRISIIEYDCVLGNKKINNMSYYKEIIR